LLAAAVFLGLSIYGLRHNNLHMVELRERVVTADEVGGDVETALANLRNYVYSHMNTNLSGGAHGIDPPIQLKSRYDRLIARQSNNVKAANEKVKRQAESVCAEKHPGGGYNSPRVACVQEYVQRNATQTGSIPDELYKFDFVSPRWAPDFAGITLVLGILSSILFLAWAALSRWMKHKAS
jgi:hypothetical protein